MRRLVGAILSSTRFAFSIADWLWQAGLLQWSLREGLALLHRALRWYLQNCERSVPGTLGGLLALWLARKFDTPVLRAMMDAAGIPMFVFYLIVIGAGALIGARLIDSRSPFDGR